MTLAFMDGFDSYSAITDMTVRGITVGGGTPTFSPTAGRFGGGALVVTGNSDSVHVPIVGTIDASASRVHWSAWIKVTALPSADTTILQLRNSAAGDNGGRMLINSSGDFIACEYNSASTVDGTAAGAMTDLGWHHIEGEHRYHASSGTHRVWVDGVLAINVTATDTYLTGTPAAIDSVRFLSGNSLDYMVDDLVVWDESGSDFNPTAPLGETRIELRLPNGDAAVQFTPLSGSDNYAMVNDSGFHDGDSSYVESTTIGHVDLYDVSNIGGTPSAVHAVAVHTRAKKTDVGSVAMKNHIKSGTTDTASANHNLTASYAQYTNYYGLNPDTTTAWDGTTFDAVQIGFEYEA